MIDIGGTDGEGASYIAMCFIFIAYFLHPVVETAYHRVRAYRAWLAIEKGGCVEVTHFNMIDEVLRGRGKWDAARVIATLLLLFSVASWVLELRMELVNITDGPVDMYDRPPPVLVEDEDSGKIWYVKSVDPLNFDYRKEGSEGNLVDPLQSGHATSLYRVGDEEVPLSEKTFVRGKTIVSFWYDEYPPADSNEGSPYSLHYSASDSGEVTLRNLECQTPSEEGDLYIDGGDGTNPWGNFAHCAEGPAQPDEGGTSSPTIILSENSNGTVHLVVEEEGSYPGFLYSVWNVIDEDDASGNVTLGHVFHIASKFRLVEAIITGIANGVTTGGGCVDLMMQFSADNPSYDTGDKERARPFGEHPGVNDVVKRLTEVEPIEHGVSLDRLGFTSLVLLVAMSLVGIGWSLSLRSSIEMDIYDRDELIRAVSLHNHSAKGKRSASMRMFVRKDAGGHVDVVVVDDDGRQDRRCPMLTRSAIRIQDEPMPAAPKVNGGTNVIPAGPTQLRLGVTRWGDWRNDFPRGHGPQSFSITSSPVLSPVTPPDPVSPAEYVDQAIAQATTFARGQLALGESSRFGSFSGRGASPRPVRGAIACATPSGPGGRRVAPQGTPSPASGSSLSDYYVTPPRVIPVDTRSVSPPFMKMGKSSLARTSPAAAASNKDNG